MSEDFENFPIWSTECPLCITGRVFLFEKGEVATCDKCKAEFDTDYQDHPELSTTQTEYWIVKKITDNH